MEMRNVKGTKDYLPEEQVLRNKIKRACEDTFGRYGCKPLETPTLNMYELMSYKYGGGDEILKEIYTLQDQGKYFEMGQLNKEDFVNLYNATLILSV